MNVKQVPLDRLIPPERNVRIHSATQLHEYARSVEMFDQTKPIICDENYMVLAGVGLYETLKSLGRETAWVNVITGLSDADKKKLMLSDNRVFELGITDNDSIDAILRDLSTDFDIPGFDSDMLEMLNRSFMETDEVVSEYGVFETSDVAKLKAREVEEHTEGRIPPAPSALERQPISQHPPSMENSSTAPESPSAAMERGGSPAPAEEDTGGRFIVCPKCGERIWL